jgi:hypothetical protein
MIMSLSARRQRDYDDRAQRIGKLGTQVSEQLLHGTGDSDPSDTLPWSALVQRLDKTEKQSLRLKIALILMAPLLLYVFIGQNVTERVVQSDPLVAADRIQLYDEDGNTRMYLRIYSGVPVMQLIDENGKPRLSLGLRYDDSPFISLSDLEGQTRATLQVDGQDQPALKLFNDKGEPTFSVN